MSFQQFINIINNSFIDFLNFIRTVIPDLLDNYFVKLIVYIGIYSIIIFLICFIIGLIYSLFENEKTRLFWENLSYGNYDRQYRRNSVRRKRDHE